MNLKTNPSIEELKELLLRFDDSECNHHLWVSYGGNVHLSKIPNAEAKIDWEHKHEGIAKFYYCFTQGNGCVGRRAAGNDVYLKNLLSDLERNWDKGSTGHITYLKLVKS